MSIKINLVYTIRMGVFLFAFLLLLVAPLSADRTQGITLEFQKQIQKNKGFRRSPKYRQRILELNLIDALKNIINTRFYQKREEYYRDLSIANVGYESPTSPKVYYMKFQNFFVRVEFEFDPETYLQRPKYIKVVMPVEDPLFESP